MADAEHIDVDSLDVLDRLVSQLGKLQLFVLVAVRSSEGVEHPRMRAWLGPNVSHLNLAALSPDAARLLVTATATGGTLPDPCISFILEHSDGLGC